MYELVERYIKQAAAGGTRLVIDQEIRVSLISDQKRLASLLTDTSATVAGTTPDLMAM